MGEGCEMKELMIRARQALLQLFSSSVDGRQTLSPMGSK